MSNVDIFAVTAESLPKWLNLMNLLARRVPEVTASEHVACVIAPSSQYVVAALALCSLQRQANLAREFESSQGFVATVIESKMHDLKHVVSTGENGTLKSKRLGGYKLPTATPPMMPLPAGFPERTASTVPEGIIQALSPDAGTGATRRAMWHYFELCANPVVVVCQRPELLRSQLEALAGIDAWWSNISRAASIDAAITPDDWFRRPVIFTTPSAILRRTWLKNLKPAAVLVVGYTAWSSPARWTWPDVPHFLILNVRQDDVLRFRSWHDGQTFPPLDSALNRLTGIPGMPAKIFIESADTLASLTGDMWEQEDDFDFG